MHCTNHAALSIALVCWELRVEAPVVNLRVCNTSPHWRVSMGLVFGLTSFGSIFLLPLFFNSCAATR